MNKKEFKNVEVGDYVQLTQHGANKGKILKVSEIFKDEFFGGGRLLVIPHECHLEFSCRSYASIRYAEKGSIIIRHDLVKHLGKTPYIPPKSNKIDPLKDIDIPISEEESEVILNIANRSGCDVDGDILKLFVASKFGKVVVIGRFITEKEEK